jgi:hypothetical protein
MYLVAVCVIGSETNENWEWFIKILKEAIGTPEGLTFSTNCGVAVMHGAQHIFSICLS